MGKRESVKYLLADDTEVSILNSCSNALGCEDNYLFVNNQKK